MKESGAQLQNKVYSGSVKSLVGLDSKRTQNRIFFPDGRAGKNAANILWFAAALIILGSTIFSFTKAGKGIFYFEAYLLGIFLIIVAGIIRYLHASYFIIDFKENLCASAWSMTDTSLTKRLFKNDYMHRIKKDDVYGVTVNYNPVGTKKVFAAKSPSIYSNLDRSKTLSEIVTSCAPVLLDKKGRIIAMTEYETGAEHEAKAHASAKIVSKLWNLPYYECPKDSRAVPIILSKAEPECSFKQLTMNDLFSKKLELFTQSTLCWVLLAIFILIGLPVGIYFYLK
ncbi:MAG: hypothetical protein PHF08_02695 [Candidatus Riflebacteria bacterium]|jgi:hypothetical protein|nr:hypothetical protein [Candidatus Riflebacteria bacterium]